MSKPPADHFEGKNVVEHLRTARAKGATASAEAHGTEMPGYICAGADAAKEMALATLIFWVIFMHLPSSFNSTGFFLLFFCGWTIWKCGRSALLGWSRMERLHRVIAEEKWEIENHRPQEREELTEIYRAKGFTDKLLTEVIDVLMADDNRLLRVMLEEELGLALEVYEHPLKQASGALIGSFASAAFLIFSYWISPFLGIGIASFILIVLSVFISSRMEKNRSLQAIVWNLSLAILAVGLVYFLSQLLIGGL
ncbi:MAG: VIT1/CCC1 transporter family protein [Chlamydiales bacterium]|nr:VIT1/CCC1 transporter family protein [Chlamydiales bacterium]